MRIVTFSKRVWKINDQQIIKAEPFDKARGIKYYNIESDYVGVVYSETENQFQLYVGRKVNGEETIKHIIGLAIKLGVNKIILEKCEVVRDLKLWDHHIIVINKMLDVTSED